MRRNQLKRVSTSLNIGKYRFDQFDSTVVTDHTENFGLNSTLEKKMILEARRGLVT